MATGCGDDRGLVPVYGTVTFAAGPMPGGGDLTFVPIEVDEGYPKRPAKAEFGTDGRYEARSFKPGDGLYPGRYRVGVCCWEVPPTPDGPSASSYIDTRFNSPFGSGLMVDVRPGGSIEFNIDVLPPAKK